VLASPATTTTSDPLMPMVIKDGYAAN